MLTQYAEFPWVLLICELFCCRQVRIPGLSTSFNCEHSNTAISSYVAQFVLHVRNNPFAHFEQYLQHSRFPF